MHRSAILLATALAASLGAVAAPGSGVRARHVAVDPLAAIVLQRLAAQPTPACLVVGLVDAKSRMAFACTRDAGPVALDGDSVFELGAVSETFTGLLLADLVRRGELSLEDAAAKYAPPGRVLPARLASLTLASLVTHGAALPQAPPGFVPHDPANPYAQFGEDDLYAALSRASPGSGEGMHRGADLGFLWLSDALSRRGGKAYPELLAERVLAPLRMSGTLGPRDARASVAGHDAAYRPVGGWDFAPQLAGAAGLRASMNELLRFAEALAGRRDSPLRAAIALAFEPVRRVAPGVSESYGWTLRERRAGRVGFRGGDTGGFHASIAVNRATRTAAIVLADTASSFDDLALHLVDADWPLSTGPDPTVVPAATRP